MAAINPEARAYVRKILQPYVDNVLKKEAYTKATRGLPKPAIGTVFEVKGQAASVIYTHIGYLQLNNPTSKKVYYHSLQDWCKSIGVEEEDVRVGL